MVPGPLTKSAKPYLNRKILGVVASNCHPNDNRKFKIEGALPRPEQKLKYHLQNNESKSVKHGSNRRAPCKCSVLSPNLNAAKK
jgi:tyrosine-protein phosphatase YwqE